MVDPIPLHIAITYQPKSAHCTSPMTHQPFPRPPLWRALDTVDDNLWNAELIRAFAQYILDHGLIGAELLEVLEMEAKRAQAGE